MQSLVITAFALMGIGMAQAQNNASETPGKISTVYTVAELELIHPPGSETLLHRTVHSFQSAVGDEKKPVLPFEVHPGDLHAAEQARFSPLQGVVVRER